MDTDNLKALALAATQGNWTVDKRSADCAYLNGPPRSYDECYFENAADAEFIAACREMVPELIAEVEESDRLLRASVPDRWKGCTSPVGAVQSYIAELEAEVERLRADAERYAFIRSGRIYIEPADGEIYVATDSGTYCKNDEEFDGEIDAAIEKEKA